MQTVLSHIFLAFLVLSLWAGNLRAQASEIQLVYYSGNAEILDNKGEGGLPALATLLSQARGKDNSVVFLHGGSAIAPSTLSSFDRGAHMIDLLNKLEPSIFSIAKKELSYKEDQLTLRSQEASFPFLSSNLFDPITESTPEGIEPFLILEVGGIKLGILSITDPEVLHDYMPRRVRPLDVRQTINSTAASVRAAGADIVLLMTEYVIPYAKDLLAQGTIDILILSDKKDGNIPCQKGLYVEHGRSDSAVIINLSLNSTGDKISWDHKKQFVSLSSYKQDPKMLEYIEGYISQLTKILEVPIGTTTTPLDTRKHSIRTSENAFGNLIADSIRSYYNADIGFMNGGGIRGNKVYPSGTILTRGDIHREVPFRDHVVHIRVTGLQLQSALENGLSGIEDVKGRFPHLSGLNVTYDPSELPGSRVKSVFVGNKPLDHSQYYSLATVNYLASGGDGYSDFKYCEHLDKGGKSRLLWEYVRDYVNKSSSISPVVEDRLKPVSK